MSDHEFDNYLALLSRLLKLGDKQRDAIAGELRSHLEDRLDELLARGISRDQAVRQALEEFGDAAAMAAEFAAIRGAKRKRWIMRLTTASVAATLLIAAGIFTFWPGHNAGPGAAKIVAQAPAGGDSASSVRTAEAADKPRAVKEILDSRLSVEFSEKPLVDVAKQLSEQSGVTIYLDARRLEEAGVNVDTPITIAFRDIRFRTLLELMLGELDLAYLIKDDILVLTTLERAESPDMAIVRVYDCRELLALPRPPGSVPKVVQGGSGGFFAVQDVPPTKSTLDQQGAGSGEDGAVQPGNSDSDNLIEVITTIVDPECWVDVGGPSSVAEYKGLLTIAATQDTHQKVERLLNMLHQAGNLRELKVTVVE
jgi:hypothetical protein